MSDIPMPDEPEGSLYDLFFDEWGFIRKQNKLTLGGLSEAHNDVVEAKEALFIGGLQSDLETAKEYRPDLTKELDHLKELLNG